MNKLICKFLISFPTFKTLIRLNIQLDAYEMQRQNEKVMMIDNGKTKHTQKMNQLRLGSFRRAIVCIS